MRRGILTVDHGTQTSIATREAVLGDDLERLENEVLARFEASLEEERVARVGAAALRLKAIRRMIQFLRAPGAAAMRGEP